MKTNRFEEILRRKLESLKPDFQAQDWEKFQSFQQPAAPSFWQTYGHWLGYAVAVVTTGAMVTLYVSQSRQNDALLQEMKELRDQISVGSGKNFQPLVVDSLATTGWKPVPRPDTVYIIEPRVIYRDRPVYSSGAPREELAESTNDQSPLPLRESFDLQKPENPVRPAASNIIQEKSKGDSLVAITEANVRPEKTQVATRNIPDVPLFDIGKAESGEDLSNATSAVAGKERQDRLPQDRLVLDDIQSLPKPSLAEMVKIESRHPMNRIPKIARRQEISTETKPKKAAENKVAAPKPALAEAPEQITKEEGLLPKFGLNLPFRVGVGQQWEGRTKAFSLWNEVLLGTHWSVQAGLSWQKLEDQKFFSEKIFVDKMREEFRKKHAPKLPPSFDIFNITARTNIVRIPLNLTYRNEIGKGFSYFAGAGTNLNLKAKQTLSFDFKSPSRDFGQEIKERTIPFPLINNVNVLVGVEKRWSPIVLQVSSFLNTRFKTFPFLQDRTDVGLQVKLLYEFKADKKK